METPSHTNQIFLLPPQHMYAFFTSMQKPHPTYPTVDPLLCCVLVAGCAGGDHSSIYPLSWDLVPDFFLFVSPIVPMCSENFLPHPLKSTLPRVQEQGGVCLPRSAFLQYDPTCIDYPHIMLSFTSHRPTSHTLHSASAACTTTALLGAWGAEVVEGVAGFGPVLN